MMRIIEEQISVGMHSLENHLQLRTLQQCNYLRIDSQFYCVIHIYVATYTYTVNSIKFTNIKLFCLSAAKRKYRLTKIM